MTKKIRVADLPDFDPAEYLGTEQAVAEYLTVILEDNDPALLAAALGDIARARGMTEIAKSSGLTREALYKALRLDAQPRFDTISRVRKMGSDSEKWGQEKWGQTRISHEPAPRCRPSKPSHCKDPAALVKAFGM